MKLPLVRRHGLAAKVLALNAPGCHKGAGSNPCSSTFHPAPCLWPGKAVENSPKPWDPAPVWDTQRKLPGSWLWISAAPAVAVTWEVNIRDLLLCLSSSLDI